MYALPTLSYEYDALAPAISEEIMRLHHQKHHQTYVATLNDALKEAPESLRALPIEELLGRLAEVPQDLRTKVRNNGGGHYNHSLFWECMTPGGSVLSSELAAALAQKHGSFEEFQEAFLTAAKGVFGSGWVWLMPDMSIVTTQNQDSPLMEGEPAPILGLDVWEHAYYLDYKNVRPEYVTAWWQVVDWAAVDRRYHTALGR